MRRWVLLAFFALLVAACGDEGLHDQGGTMADEPERPLEDRTMTGDDSVQDQPPPTGDVPGDLLAEIFADASQRTGLPESAFEVIRAQYVDWPDGSLGCPQPGVFYTQAIESGYWVELLGGDVVLDYRATVRGRFVLCPTGTEGADPTGPADR